MTIKELIEQLQKHDQDRVVMVDGYEGGLDSDIGISTGDVVLNVNAQDYYGPHELAPYHTTNHPLPTVQALILSRK